MNKWNKTSMERVAVLPWPGIDGAYLCVSGSWNHPEGRAYGRRWYYGPGKHAEQKDKIQKMPDKLKIADYVEPRITFLFNSGDCCAEWDGAYGPIQLWYKCDADFVNEDGYDKAKPYWFFDHAFGSGHWSQCAVDEAGLAKSFVDGDYRAIFFELERWAKR